jgi:starch phosphorylase
MDDLETQAEKLTQKIRHFIITSSGQTCENATMSEFYQAFCSALREEVMINWTATLDTIQNKKARIAYLFSMEYLPGRLTSNNMNNIGATELVRTVLARMNRNFNELIACEPDPGLGNGGLGRLASCFLDSLATLQYPARAYGLRYQYGIFEQEIWNGKQVERPDCWLLNVNPWEQRRDSHAVSVKFLGKPIPATNKHGEEIYLIEETEEVRALPYDTPIIGYSEKNDFSVLTLRLWSTKESPRNFQLQRYNAGFIGQAAENTTLTDVLYPNDNTDIGKRIRLKQEFLLVSASLHDLMGRHLRVYGDLSEFKDKVRIQINDTHPALVIAELVRSLMKNYEFTWKEAWETCQEVCSYTNHTILRESLEDWNELRLQELLPRQHNIIQRLNLEFCNTVRSRFPDDEARVRRMSVIEEGQIRMAHLAMIGSHKVNGVAKLHTEILKNQLFKDFYDLWPDKFANVTNGVTQRRWLLHANPLLASFITKRIGSGWITDFKQLAKLAPFASERTSQEEFLAIKQKNKEALLEFLHSENCMRDDTGKIIVHTHPLGPNALFDVQIKRFHEYKRQLLNALHLIMIYHELKANPQSRSVPRFALFAGKAAPGYERAKQILQLICALGRTLDKDPIIRTRLAVHFIENYNVSKAEIIIPAADLSEQISTAGWEASGTGNMKLAMNGALTIGTDDGANIEMRASITDPHWPFLFGATAEQNRQPYNAWDTYISDEPIRRAVDSLKDGTFDTSPSETASFAALHRSLTEGDAGGPPDRFRLLQDLRAYHTAQLRVESLFLTPLKWAETALHNIAAMGPFSTDESIRRYASIWGLKPCPPDPSILARVRAEYAEHDRCKITR